MQTLERRLVILRTHGGHVILRRSMGTRGPCQARLLSSSPTAARTCSYARQLGGLGRSPDSHHTRDKKMWSSLAQHAERAPGCGERQGG